MSKLSTLVSYAISSDEEEDVSGNGASCPVDNKKRNGVNPDNSECGVKRKRQDAGEPGSKSLKQKLPLPSDIANMFKSPTQHQEDSAEHQGRLRSFPHERGNWASYVFIPFDDDSWCKELASSLIQCLRPELEFTMVDHFHVSLSRTFVLQHHWIDPLVDSLREKLTSFMGTLIDFSSVDFYCNDEKSRTFLGIKVCAGSDSLLRYTSAVDRSLEEFRLPKYYKEPSFHMSLVWALGDVRARIKSETHIKLQQIVDEHFCANPRSSIAGVKNLRLKTGNKEYGLNLNCR